MSLAFFFKHPSKRTIPQLVEIDGRDNMTKEIWITVGYQNQRITVFVESRLPTRRL